MLQAAWWLPTLLDKEPEPDFTDIAFHGIIQNGIGQGQLSYDLSKYGCVDPRLHTDPFANRDSLRPDDSASVASCRGGLTLDDEHTALSIKC
jgi:hypothetical protein